VEPIQGGGDRQVAGGVDHAVLGGEAHCRRGGVSVRFGEAVVVSPDRPAIATGQ
jgi:hypothetical protein